MSDGIYRDARHYDAMFGAFADGADLDYYARQIGRYGGPVLELMCGTGRLTIPLAQQGIEITGVDHSGEMLALARAKASAQGVAMDWHEADACDFDLNCLFGLIFIPANSLTHLLTRTDQERCLAAVRRHLAPGGRFLLDMFTPSCELLSRDPAQCHPLRTYADPETGAAVTVTETSRYDRAAQINHIQWFSRTDGTDAETVAALEMRLFYPQELDALLHYNGFAVEHKYGDFDESTFTSASPRQLLVCRPAPLPRLA